MLYPSDSSSLGSYVGSSSMYSVLNKNSMRTTIPPPASAVKNHDNQCLGATCHSLLSVVAVVTSIVTLTLFCWTLSGLNSTKCQGIIAIEIFGGIVVSLLCISAIILLLGFCRCHIEGGRLRVQRSSRGYREYDGRRCCGFPCTDAFACCFLSFLAVLAVFLTILLSIFYVMANGSAMEGLYKIKKASGLMEDGRVEIDKNGIPHIIATSSRDAFFLQGMITAQQRLWQMEFQRLGGQGRLSEAVGTQALGVDSLTRVLGVPRRAREIFDSLESEERSSLEAYAAGVNAYINSQPLLPLEFRVLQHRPEPWHPTDSIDLFRLSLIVEEGYTFEYAEELWPSWNIDRFDTVLSWEDVEEGRGPPSGQIDAASVKDSEDLATWLNELYYLRNIPETDEELVPEEHLVNHLDWPFSQLWDKKPFLGVGSNAWVVSGNFTKSGLPLLANDPHLPFVSPSSWHLIHLETPQLSVIGAALPGLPSVVTGHNSHIAWGITAGGVDSVDVYILKENENNTSYWYNDRFIEYEHREEIIKVKNQEDVVLNIRDTVFGPVISDHPLPKNYGESYGLGPLVIHSMELDSLVNDSSISGWLRLQSARNWDEFHSAISFLKSPSLNFMFADTTGSIGYQLAGAVPRRQIGHSGRYPAPGDVRFDWKRDENGVPLTVPFEFMPYSLNPPKGYLVSANNRITPLGFEAPGYVLSRDVPDPTSGYRVSRILELLDRVVEEGDLLSTKKADAEDMKTIQLDTTVSEWKEFRPIIEDMDTSVLSDVALFWREKLLDWDGNMNHGSRVATVYARWKHELLRYYPPFDAGGSRFAVYMISVMHSEGHCTDDCLTDDEFCQWHCLRIVPADALSSAVASLNLKAGKEASAPGWGVNVHHVVFKHRIFQNTILECLGNIEVSGVGGDWESVLATPANNDETMSSFQGPSYRHVIDLGDLSSRLFEFENQNQSSRTRRNSVENQSFYVLAPGQCEGPFSRHHTDMLEMWVKGSYVPMSRTLSTEDLLRRYLIHPAELLDEDALS